MQRRGIYLLLVSVVGLVTLGVVMLFSTSAFAQDSHGDIYYFVKRQGFWLVIGVGVCVAGSLVDYHRWRDWWPYVYGLSALLLALCFVPHVGMRINGSLRWLNLHFAAFQPSEVAKIGALFFLCWWFSRPETEARRIMQGLILPMSVVSVLLALIAAEVDLGTTALIASMAVGICFLAGANMFLIAGAVGVGLAGLLGAALLIPERCARIMSFLHPEKDQLGKGLQQWQALIAFGSGGFEGLGLGEGRQKMLYLPYAHTDFIFPMIGEELGLRFTWLVVLGFILIILSGGLIAANAKDRFGKLLAMGILLLISLQAAVNIGMTTSLLPNKGMPLPFISYGGSNLAVSLFMVGILINIHRTGAPIASVSRRQFVLAARSVPRI